MLRVRTDPDLRTDPDPKRWLRIRNAGSVTIFILAGTQLRAPT